MLMFQCKLCKDTEYGEWASNLNGVCIKCWEKSGARYKSKIPCDICKQRGAFDLTSQFLCLKCWQKESAIIMEKLSKISFNLTIQSV